MIEIQDSQIVFIRRPHRQSYVLTGTRVVPGFSADQIILDFHDEATLLNIASHGHVASLDIANRLASAFYDQECRYENVTEATFAAQSLTQNELSDFSKLWLVMVANYDGATDALD